MKNIPFTIVNRIIRYLGINLSEMYWTYLEKIIQVLIEETIRHFHFYNILKISILPKL